MQLFTVHSSSLHQNNSTAHDPQDHQGHFAAPRQRQHSRFIPANAQQVPANLILIPPLYQQPSRETFSSNSTITCQKRKPHHFAAHSVFECMHCQLAWVADEDKLGQAKSHVTRTYHAHPRGNTAPNNSTAHDPQDHQAHFAAPRQRQHSRFIPANVQPADSNLALIPCVSRRLAGAGGAGNGPRSQRWS
jgi:hypothetical protein